MTSENDQAKSQGRRLAKLRTCKVRGRTGTFYVLRLFKHKASILPADGLGGEGIVVDRADLREIQDPDQQPGLFPHAHEEEPEEQGESAQVEPIIETSAPPPPPMPLPYGLLDLDNQIITDRGPPFRVRCFVKGCTEMLRPPARKFRGDCCPVHGIHCHCSGSSITYTYADPRRNLVTSPDLFMKKVRWNKHKVESHRFGYCNSEDAASWVFWRSLQEAGCLHLVAQWITGREVQSEPLLYLWGLSSFDNHFRPWDLLTEARKRYEIGKLPVKRPFSEMDVTMVIPGHMVAIVEVKLLAPDPIVYRGQPRSSSQSLTFEELVEIYHDDCLRMLDFEKVRTADWIPSQLYRYVVLGEFISQLESPHTEFYMCNLVRAGQEHEANRQLSGLLRPEFASHHRRLTWESLYSLCGLHRQKLSRLLQYMLTKAVGVNGRFVPAFHLDQW